MVELCQPRLESLKKSIERDLANPGKPATRGPTRPKKTFNQASKTFGGYGPAIVAFLLESVYNIQVVAGINPGVEFREPIVGSSWRLVCGDAPASDTVKNLYNVFATPLQSVTGVLPFAHDIFQRIFLPPSDGLKVIRVLFGEPSRIMELIRLIIPITTLSCVLALAGNAGALAFEATPVASVLVDGYMATTLPIIVSFLQFLLICYISVSSLRFMKVLISDRDRIITQNVLNTTRELQLEKQGAATVCVVVGLLHVNGILRLIQDENEAYGQTTFREQ